MPIFMYVHRPIDVCFGMSLPCRGGDPVEVCIFGSWSRTHLFSFALLLEVVDFESVLWCPGLFLLVVTFAR